LQLKEYQLEVNKALDRYLPKKGKLAQAMRYSVFAGGKRFRPILCVATAQALGKPHKQILPLACAIEMLHTFTLIHDDLPAMDNSDYRRGKLTCHKKFDEATAVLAGDALNTFAFQLIANNAKVVTEVSAALMLVVDGQIDDLASQGKKISLKQLKEIHRKKTAALLIACVKSAGLELGASPKQLKALADYGLHAGLAFQIADDILDATSTQEVLGKPVKADVDKGFPHFVGLEKSLEMAALEQKKALKALKIFGGRAELLKAIAEYVVKREK